MSEDTEVNESTVSYPRGGDKAETGTAYREPDPINAWKFVPLLYVLQVIPVTVVQDLATLFYKDFGIDNLTNATWTGIISLPWSLQFLLGPLVDLSAKKRKWVLMGQMILTVCLALAPFLLLPGAKAFNVSLIFLGITAFVSALTNIATDGFYMLSLTRKQQASFAGIQTASYRAGSLLCMSLVPFLVGYFMRFNEVKVETGGNLYIAVQSANGKETGFIRNGEFHLSQGELVTKEGKKLLDAKGKPVEVPGTENAFVIQNGAVEFGQQRIPLGLYQMGKVFSDNPAEGSAKLTAFPTNSVQDTFRGGQANRAVPAPFAWFVSLLSVAVIYALLMFPARKLLPESINDPEPTDQQKGQFRANLGRTAMILGLYASTYFAISAVWRLMANVFSNLGSGLNGWALKDNVTFLGIQTQISGMNAELIQFVVCAPMMIGLIFLLRNSLRGSEMGAAFSSFFRQASILPILGFLVFYRFPEAMVRKMAPLFLKDPRTEPAFGLALDNMQVGYIKGTIGMVGIILGGIVGGILASKIGLRRGFWVIAILMHLPILLYLYASMAQPHNLAVIGTVEFIDQFGYGLGYAGYSVYLMSVARRGNHVTAHYAIGTGIGGTVIAVAGITAAAIQASTDYRTTFASALLFAIPGLIALKFIPHEEEGQKA